MWSPRCPRWNYIGMEEPKDSEKILSQCHHKSPWIDLGANLGRRGERSATKRLSHGTTHSSLIIRRQNAFFQDADVDIQRLNTEKAKCMPMSRYQEVGQSHNTKVAIELKEKFLRFRRDGVSISYTLICLSHFDVCLAIT
jgi:hypothetical protein